MQIKIGKEFLDNFSISFLCLSAKFDFKNLSYETKRKNVFRTNTKKLSKLYFLSKMLLNSAGYCQQFWLGKF
jgi:hypothetical protein